MYNQMDTPTTGGRRRPEPEAYPHAHNRRRNESTTGTAKYRDDIAESRGTWRRKRHGEEPLSDGPPSSYKATSGHYDGDRGELDMAGRELNRGRPFAQTEQYTSRRNVRQRSTSSKDSNSTERGNRTPNAKYIRVNKRHAYNPTDVQRGRNQQGLLGQTNANTDTFNLKPQDYIRWILEYMEECMRTSRHAGGSRFEEEETNHNTQPKQGQQGARTGTQDRHEERSPKPHSWRTPNRVHPQRNAEPEREYEYGRHPDQQTQQRTHQDDNADCDKVLGVIEGLDGIAQQPHTHYTQWLTDHHNRHNYSETRTKETWNRRPHRGEDSTDTEDNQSTTERRRDHHKGTRADYTRPVEHNKKVNPHEEETLQQHLRAIQQIWTGPYPHTRKEERNHDAQGEEDQLVDRTQGAHTQTRMHRDRTALNNRQANAEQWPNLHRRPQDQMHPEGERHITPRRNTDLRDTQPFYGTSQKTPQPQPYKWNYTYTEHNRHRHSQLERERVDTTKIKHRHCDSTPYTAHYEEHTNHLQRHRVDTHCTHAHPANAPQHTNNTLGRGVDHKPDHYHTKPTQHRNNLTPQPHHGLNITQTEPPKTHWQHAATTTHNEEELLRKQRQIYHLTQRTQQHNETEACAHTLDKERHIKEGTKGRGTPQHTPTPHTERFNIDIDTQRNAHLLKIWRAIHIYDNTIPTTEWTKYKQLILNALQIAHENSQTTSYRLNDTRRQPTLHRRDPTENATETQHTQIVAEVSRHYTTPRLQMHEDNTAHTHTPGRPTNETSTTGSKPPLETRHPPITSVRPPPTRAAHTNKISWADIVRTPPRKTNVEVLEHTRVNKDKTPQGNAYPETHRPPTEPLGKQKPIENINIRKEATERAKHTTPQTLEHKTQDTTKHTTTKAAQNKTTPNTLPQPVDNRDTNSHTQTTQQTQFITTLTQTWIWKTRKAQNMLTGDTFKDRNNINYYTNILAGPPAYLNDKQKETWANIIHTAKEKCRTDILIPALEEKATYWKTKRQETNLTDAEKLEDADKTLNHIWNIWTKKGLRSKDIAKIIREANLFEDFIPAPPPPQGTASGRTTTTAPTHNQKTAIYTPTTPIQITTTQIDKQQPSIQTGTKPTLRRTTTRTQDQEMDTHNRRAPTPKQAAASPDNTHITQITPTDVITASTLILKTLQNETLKTSDIDTTAALNIDTQDTKPITHPHKVNTVHTPKQNPTRQTPHTHTNTQARQKYTIPTSSTSPGALMGQKEQGHQNIETNPNTKSPKTLPPSTQTHNDTQNHTNATKLQDIHTTQNKQQHTHSPDRKSPNRLPTPIIVETPKAHYTLRPRTPITYTQIGTHNNTPRHKPHTSNYTNQKTATQIDLTIDTSPEASITPRNNPTQEDDIIFYTPDRHTHTPALKNHHTTFKPDKIQTPKQPITEGDHRPINKNCNTLAPYQEKSTQPKYNAQTIHTRTHPEIEPRQKSEETPSTQTLPRHKSTKTTSNGDHNTRPQHTTTTRTIEPTDRKKTEHSAHTQIQTTDPKGHIGKDPRHRQESTTEPQPDPPDTYLNTEHTHPPEKNQTHGTKDKSNEPQTNSPKDTRGPRPPHTNKYQIQEEEWRTFCNETFEDIELDISRQTTPITDKSTSPQKHQHRLDQSSAQTDTLHQQIEAAIERQIDFKTIQEEDWQAIHKNTKTDTPLDTGHQDAVVLNTNANLADKLDKPPNTDPPNVALFQRLVDRAKQLASYKTTQVAPPNEQRENTTATHHRGVGTSNLERSNNRLKNLKRKYKREQKKIREGYTTKKASKKTPSIETTNTVYDYTTKGLTQAEKEILGLGKSFITTQNAVDIDRVKTDIATFIRRLRLHYIFRERQPETRQHNLDLQRQHKHIQKPKQPHKGIHTQWRKPKSTFQPDETQRDINQIERNIEISIATQLTNRKKGKPNIPTQWMTAIDTLKHRIADKEITITQADKGGGIIAVDYDMYITKGTKYIEEEAGAYVLDHTPEELIIAQLAKERGRVIKKLKEVDILPTDTATYATHQTIEKITGMKFYYKIHKTTDIHTMPVRPLQSCIGSPTQHISQVLTDIYEPYINNTYIPTYIRDTNHTLYELDGTTIRETDILAIADVVALYPSIEHEKGLKAIKDFTREHIYNDENKAEALTNAFRLVITQNYVKWQGNIYKQTRGVAMGTPVAVTYANIYMNAVDKKIAETCTYIKLHKRFIDDNLHIIPISKKEEFGQTLNTIDPPALKYTVAYLGDTPHDTTLPFLDIKFYLDNTRKLCTRLYTKDTDKHQYLIPYSQHPRHIIRNIPRGVFARIRRICLEDTTYREDSDLAIGWLKERGYNEKILAHIRQDAGKRDRWQMIREIEERARNLTSHTNNFTTIPFINTYATPTKAFSNIIQNQKTALDNIFTRARVKTLNAYRRKQNLGDLLIQPSLRIPIEGTNTAPRVFRQCGKHPHTKPCPCTGLHDQTLCRVCAHIAQDDINIKTKIHRPITCDSKNIIYMIWCDACNMKYIGETQQKIRDRFTQHLYNLDIQDQDFYNHFRQPGHGATHMKLAIIETFQTDEPLYRKIRESTWIRQLKTYRPFGLNNKVKESPLDALQQCNKQANDRHLPPTPDTHTLKKPQTAYPDPLHTKPKVQASPDSSNHTHTLTTRRSTSHNTTSNTQQQRQNRDNTLASTQNQLHIHTSTQQPQGPTNPTYRRSHITPQEQCSRTESTDTQQQKDNTTGTAALHTHHNPPGKGTSKNVATPPTRRSNRLNKPITQTQ